jgi:hypothetical protein
MEPWLLTQIAELVLRLPGVTIRYQRQSGSGCYLDLYVEDSASLLRLVWCATVSNVCCQVLLIPDHFKKITDFDPKKLIYRIFSEGDPHPPEGLSGMEVFGINLASVLHEDGILDFATSDALRERFNRR